MGSDYAPIICILCLDSAYKLDTYHKADPRFNFFKADWESFEQVVDSLTRQTDFEEISDLKNRFSNTNLVNPNTL